MFAQPGQQGKKEKHRGDQLDCKPEFHRNTDVIPIETDDGNENRSKKKGRRDAQRKPRSDKGRKNSSAAAPGSELRVGAAFVGCIQKMLPERYSGNQPRTRCTKSRAGDEKHEDPMLGNPDNKLMKTGLNILHHKSACYLPPT